MIGLDTNVLIRFLVEDDPDQSRRARALIERELAQAEPVLISMLVLLETEWVLRSSYALGKSEVAATISSILDAAEVRVEQEPVVERALAQWRDSSANFADCLIGADHAALGCRATVSFDSKAVKLPTFISL